MMEFHLHIIGSLLVLLALLHIVFPSYFEWEKELSVLSTINREMMVVHTFFIALTVLLMGILCLTSAQELTSTVLGQRIEIGLAIFWTCRFLIQLFGYSSALWRGKKLETVVHVLFTVLWLYMSIIFILIAIGFPNSKESIF